MISSIIFSKDRPLQLDLTLRTLKKNFSQCNSNIIIYKATTPEFQQSYTQLISEHTDCLFKHQGDNFFRDCLDALFQPKSHYYCLLTDDIIFFDRVQTTIDHMNLLFSNPYLACISLRLGLNIKMRDYTGDGRFSPDVIPRFERSGHNHIIWNRTEIPIGGYWSSPLCVDGHIFRSKDLIDMWTTIYNWPESEGGIESPNSLESYMHRFFFEMPVMMASEKWSRIVNSPNNRVQQTHKNAFGNDYSYDPIDLNNLFLEGKRIKTISINKNEIVCPHQEIDILQGLE